MRNKANIEQRAQFVLDERLASSNPQTMLACWGQTFRRNILPGKSRILAKDQLSTNTEQPAGRIRNSVGGVRGPAIRLYVLKYVRLQ